MGTHQQSLMSLHHVCSVTVATSWPYCQLPWSRRSLPHGLPACGDEQIPALGQSDHEAAYIKAADLAHAVISPHGQEEGESPCGTETLRLESNSSHGHYPGANLP